MHDSSSRRRFFAVLAGAVVGAIAAPGLAIAGGAPRRFGRNEHPEPRPDVDASRVLRADQLDGSEELITLYDSIREIPHIVDGIRCYCGCAQLEGYRSLLVCYEENGMAKHCDVCQGEGRLAYRRWKEGQSLEQIRRAIDARFAHDHGATPHHRHPRF